MPGSHGNSIEIGQSEQVRNQIHSEFNIRSLNNKKFIKNW